MQILKAFDSHEVIVCGPDGTRTRPHSTVGMTGHHSIFLTGFCQSLLMR